MTLELGDVIFCRPSTGLLGIRRPDGRIVDLNALRLEATADSGEDATQRLSVVTFGHLTSLLAATYGLVAGEVEIWGTYLAAPVKIPGGR